MNLRVPLLAALLAATPLLAAPAAAQGTPAAAPRELGAFNSWRAFVHQGSGGRQCYALGAPSGSEPRDIQPGTARRGATHLFITHRPGQNVRNEISVVIGYSFRPNTTATLEVVSQAGTRRFVLYTRDQGAWVQNQAEEAQLIAAMRAGRELRVRGTSARGTNTVDTYQLAGVSGAIDRIAQECR
jgi:hypothetical protein